MISFVHESPSNIVVKPGETLPEATPPEAEFDIVDQSVSETAIDLHLTSRFDAATDASRLLLRAAIIESTELRILGHRAEANQLTGAALLIANRALNQFYAETTIGKLDHNHEYTTSKRVRPAPIPDWKPIAVPQPTPKRSFWRRHR